MMDQRPPLTADMLPGAPTPSDRLPPMLFLAALFHALLILGLTFDPGLAFKSDGSLTMDVVVLQQTDQSLETPSEDAYLAAVSQQGSGDTELDVDTGRLPAGTAIEAQVQELLGDFAPDEMLPGETETAVVTTEGDAATAMELSEDADPETPSSAEAPEIGVNANDVLPENMTGDGRITDTNPRELVFGVDTQESVLANYLARWKARIEARGTDYYNRQVSGLSAAGAPIIEVAIDGDGNLKEVSLLRTSGDSRIDQAALNVLRHAAPYDPIPAHLRADYDQLRFRYKFQFELLN